MDTEKLRTIHRAIAACRACPGMVGPPVHGPAFATPIFLLGQAPGPHEGRKGRPFAHTAGRTLFRWFEESAGVDEAEFRAKVYMAAVARCFPGKAPGGADRVPDASEIERCSRHVKLELEALKPRLILAVGKLAIGQVLGPARFGKNGLLAQVVGKVFEAEYHGHRAEVVCLPHPSGVSSWHKVEPGRSLLREALRQATEREAWLEVFGRRVSAKPAL